MDRFVTLTLEDRDRLVAELQSARIEVRIAVDADGVKVRPDHYAWGPGMGVASPVHQIQTSTVTQPEQARIEFDGSRIRLYSKGGQLALELKLAGWGN